MRRGNGGVFLRKRTISRARALFGNAPPYESEGERELVKKLHSKKKEGRQENKKRWGGNTKK